LEIENVIIFTIKITIVNRKYILPLFFVFQILIIKILAIFPKEIEQYYSNGFYPIISRFLRSVFGAIPFSIGDVIYASILIYVIYILLKYKKNWLRNWKNSLLKLVSVLSLFYFLFHLLWATNYYRVPLSEKLKIKKEYTDKELLDFTQKLITKTNATHIEITKNKSIKVSNPSSRDKIFVLSQNGYDQLSKEYPFFSYEVPSRKQSLFSVPLTYMGFGGYLNPFTNESQVNYKLPIYGYPFVISHEMAHQIGYASESECNFIAFLACIKNDNLYFKYAAYSMALRYSLANVKLIDEKKFNVLKSRVNLGIIENFKENDSFWKQYDTFIDKGFHVFYDQFLKINQQEDGIDSYSKFIDLLINYYNNKAIE